MKLQHLAIGARFEYEGVVFVKTGPLTASSEQGGQRIIPRHAMLRPLDVPEPETGRGKPGELSRSRVRTAFDEFYGRCAALVDAGSQAELEAARQRFLAALLK